MTKGVILGRFMPPHLGHMALIGTATRLVDDLTIVLCVQADDPIPAAMRQQWLAELAPQARIVVADERPLDPAAPDFCAHWGQVVTRASGAKPDRILGSVPYVAVLAEHLGSAHTVLDPMRLAIPVRGRDIRRDPVGNWAHIPGPVRGFYQKRLTLVGPESVGKSYLAGLLAARFGGPFVPEYGRPYEKFRTTGEYAPAELLEIARVHAAHRAALAPMAGPVLFEDTDPLMTAVWAEMLLGQALPALEAQIAVADHYILLDAEVPWEEDPIRYFGRADRRKLFFERTRAKLEAHGASYTLVSGDYTAREAQAVAITEAMIASVGRA